MFDGWSKQDYDRHETAFIQCSSGTACHPDYVFPLPEAQEAPAHPCPASLLSTYFVLWNENMSNLCLQDEEGHKCKKTVALKRDDYVSEQMKRPQFLGGGR